MQCETPVWRTGNILVKMEALQPGCSHKARAARHIIRRAIGDGQLIPGGERRILEKTGGNLGVGLVFEAARHGIGVDLVIGLSFSRIKRSLCERYGARVICEEELRQGSTPKQVIADLIEEHSDRWFFTDQFANRANLQAHMEETGPEAAKQIAQALRPGQRVILVKGAGTGASFQGIAHRLRECFDNLTCELVMPAGCDFVSDHFTDHPLEGFAVGVRPPFLDLRLVDRFRTVTADQARDGQRAMAQSLGFFPGMTSGANFAAALGAAHENPGALVFTLAYDNGEAYLAPPMEMASPQCGELTDAA